MFILKLTYKKTLDEVEKHLKAHVDYLNKHYVSGHFIASGRQIPRSGGIILCRASNKDEVIKIMQDDPFWFNQIADYEIIEFTPSKYADGFDTFIN